jgi:hypothetical protein
VIAVWYGGSFYEMYLRIWICVTHPEVCGAPEPKPIDVSPCLECLKNHCAGVGEPPVGEVIDELTEGGLWKVVSGNVPNIPGVITLGETNPNPPSKKCPLPSEQDPQLQDGGTITLDAADGGANPHSLYHEMLHAYLFDKAAGMGFKKCETTAAQAQKDKPGDPDNMFNKWADQIIFGCQQCSEVCKDVFTPQ